MPIVDDRTEFRNYPLPSALNNLDDDVARLIEAFNAIDADLAAAIADVAGKASASHTHAIADVTGLQTALNGKAATGHTHGLNDLTDVSVGGATNGQFFKRVGTVWVPASIAQSDVAGLSAALAALALSAADVLAMVKSVDGESSGLDADVVRGVTPTALGLALLALGTNDAPQLGGINVGHPTDTLLARAAAGKLTVAGVRLRLVSDSSEIVTIPNSAGPTFDAQDGLTQIARLVATANRQIAAPTNPVDGQKVIIEHTASGGARTMSLVTGNNGQFRFGTDIAGLSETASGKTDRVGIIYSGAAQRWDVVAYAKGF